MKYFNYNLAKQIIETFKKIDDIQKVAMGMQEDWFWTAETVFEDSKYCDNFKQDKHHKLIIGGIEGSKWATPVIQITMQDDTIKIFECFDGESTKDILTKIKMEMDCTQMNGVLSGPVNEARIKAEILKFEKK